MREFKVSFYIEGPENFTEVDLVIDRMILLVERAGYGINTVSISPNE